jgi:hypothetical protein
MLKFGFKAKTKLTFSSDEVEFCSSVFAPVLRDGQPCHILVPKFGKQMFKMFVSLKYQPNPIAWLRGIVIGHRNLLRKFPVVGDLI